MLVVQETTFEVGKFNVDPNRNVVSSGSKAVAVEPRVMEVLCLLAAHPGEVVLRSTLIEKLWKVDVGAEDRLTRAVSQLRKALRDCGAAEPYLETIPKRGYRLVADVKRVQPRVRELGDGPVQKTGVRSVPRSSVLAAAVLLMGAVGFFVVSKMGPEVTQSPVSGAGLIPTSPTESVAVIPFVAIGEPDGSLLAEGLAEELLNTLAAVDGLKVPGRTSSFAASRLHTTLGDIGKELGVAHVLEGSVQLAGDRVRVNVRLVEVADGFNVWAKSFDDQFDEIFEVQNEISLAVVAALKAEFTSGQGDPLYFAGSESSDAYRLYLEGRQLLNRRGLNISRAISTFEDAIQLDPNYAEAYSGLAIAHLISTSYLQTPPALARSRAEANAQIAMRLDPTLAEPVATLAAMNGLAGQWEQCVILMDRAEQLNPQDPVTLMWGAEVLMDLGYLARALEKAERAVEIDPGSAVVNLVAGNGHAMLGDYATARRYYEKSHAMGNHKAGANLGLLLRHEGDREAAVEYLLESLAAIDVVPQAELSNFSSDWSLVDAGELSMEDLLAQYPSIQDDSDLRGLLYLYAGDAEGSLTELGRDEDNDKVRFYQVWSDYQPVMRQDANFKWFAESTGLLGYWKAHGWPDKCQPHGDDAFQCI